MEEGSKSVAETSTWRMKWEKIWFLSSPPKIRAFFLGLLTMHYQVNPILREEEILLTWCVVDAVMWSKFFFSVNGLNYSGSPLLLISNQDHNFLIQWQTDCINRESKDVVERLGLYCWGLWM